MQHINVIEFTEGDYYKSGTITVEVDARHFVLKAFKGVSPEYRFPKRDDHVLTEDEDKFNRVLYALTSFIEDETFTWSEKKQLYWSGECNVDDDYEPIETEDGQWVTAANVYADRLDTIKYLINDVDDYSTPVLKHINDIINAEQEALMFELKFSTVQVLKEGFMTRLRARNYDQKDGSYDYDMLIEERIGEEVGRVVAVHDHYAVAYDAESKRFTLYYVTSDDAEVTRTFKSYEDVIEYFEEETECI